VPVTPVDPDQSVGRCVEGEIVVLTINGCLDGETGATLLKRATAALQERACRVDIDLRSLTGFTDQGAAALGACRRMCTGLPDGLHYRTGQGPGRQALLAAFDEEH
jgi:hypothetical protein